jgi:tRNA pseudouridine32 synthase/23S rRNA pseudouridine746 synthase
MSAQNFLIPVTTTGARVIDLLAEHSGLPKQRLKDALAKGAVWLHRGKHETRLRRATKELLGGDKLALYYDAEVLQREPPAPTLIADERDYSVWFKPAGMLAQGTQYGDHCALLRWSETAFTPARTSFLIHRLDREAEGLMVIAHSPRAAKALSQLWQSSETAQSSEIGQSSETKQSVEKAIEKIYAVTVEGLLDSVGSQRRIDLPLDGKPSISEIEVIDHDVEKKRTTLRIKLITGRKHQIRRHLAAIGHAVVGDYRYGRGGEPLQLRATELKFRCPLTQRERYYRADSKFAAF